MPRKLTETLRQTNESINEFIIELLCKDFNQKEIAEMLEISKSTVELRIKKMKHEYNVKTLTGLIAKFLEL